MEKSCCRAIIVSDLSPEIDFLVDFDSEFFHSCKFCKIHAHRLAWRRWIRSIYVIVHCNFEWICAYLQIYLSKMINTSLFLVEYAFHTIFLSWTSILHFITVSIQKILKSANMFYLELVLNWVQSICRYLLEIR